MKYITSAVVLSMVFAGVLTVRSVVLAQNTTPSPVDRFEQTAGRAFQGTGIVGNTQQNDLPTIIGQIIGTALSFLGIIFLVLTIYGGLLWMTAGGNAEKVGKAIALVTQAGIGLAIVMAAYLITRYVGTAIINVLS